MYQVQLCKWRVPDAQVFSGHVHAYERHNRVNNYAIDPCAPMYFTVRLPPQVTVA